MRLNHLNLTVPDVARTREFFETYFGLRCVTEKGRDALAVLVDESGFILTLNNFEKATEVEYPGAFHIGFMQESPGAGGRDPSTLEVRRVRRRAAQGIPWGLDVLLPRPGGFLVEVGHQHRDDRGRNRDERPSGSDQAPSSFARENSRTT